MDDARWHQLESDIANLKARNQQLEDRITALEQQTNRPQARYVEPSQLEPTVSTSQPLLPRLEFPSSTNGQLETALGLRGFAWMGILALVTGLGFFIRFAFVNRWIGHQMLIILGVLLGLGLVAAGEWLARKASLTVWARTVASGGLALMYFAIYAAWHFPTYRLATGITQELDLLLLTAVVVFSMGLAWRDPTRSIASRAFLLGFATALLSQEMEWINLLYTLLLTAGLAVLASVKRWPEIALGGVFGSYLLHGLWLYRHPEQIELGLFSLLLYFAMYHTVFVRGAGTAISKAFVNRTFAMGMLNSLMFFGLALWRLQHHPPVTLVVIFCLLYGAMAWLGQFAPFAPTEPTARRQNQILLVINSIGMLWLVLTQPIFEQAIPSGLLMLSLSALYSGLFIWAQRSQQSDLGPYLLHLGLFHLFLTSVAFFDGALVTLLWTIQAAAMLWAGLNTSITSLQTGTVWLLGVIGLRSLLFDYQQFAHPKASLYGQATNATLYAQALPTLLLTLLLLFIMAWWVQQAKHTSLLKDSRLPIAVSWPAPILGASLLFIAGQSWWISIGWALLGSAILVLGLVQHQRQFRLQGLVLLLLTVGKLFLFDTRQLDTGWRTLSFIVLGLLLLGVSFLYTRYQERIQQLL